MFWTLELLYDYTELEGNSTLQRVLDDLYPGNHITCGDQTILLSVLSQLNRRNLGSTNWFPASAGMTLFLLGSLRFIRQWPRDKWEWRSGLILIVGGLIYIPLSILDIGAELQVEFTNCQDGSVHVNSPVWIFAFSGWPLPSFAILMVLVMVCDAGCDHFTRKAFKKKLSFRPRGAWSSAEKSPRQMHTSSSPHTSPGPPAV